MIAANILLNQSFQVVKLMSSLLSLYGHFHRWFDRYGISVLQISADMFQLSSSQSCPPFLDGVISFIIAKYVLTINNTDVATNRSRPDYFRIPIPLPRPFFDSLVLLSSDLI